MASIHRWAHKMTPQDKQFYQQLGKRVAQLRKDQGLTQTQLAEILGISQQTMAHYEVGRLRVAVAMLPALAKALAVSIEELMDVQPTAAKGKRGPTPALQRQIEQISQLPRTKQKFVMEMLETVIQQAG
ncbi:MAG: helix-turn-helix domain-containing protein [Gammaproteobacteria bacterium]|nr:helix-turn-helix domain-containing protein [Gammaproteobacteria bacterium]